MEKKVISTFFFLIIIFFLNLVSASNVGLMENTTWQQNLTPVRFSATAFGDIDNDGDLDLALTGCLSAGASRCDNGAISKIYINNGVSLIESQQWQQNLTGAGYGSLAFGDVDNDGDLDLALSGCPNGTETLCNNVFSKIYINNGSTLTESSQWQNNLTGQYSGGISLADIDNDGRLDLGLVGVTENTRVAKIYLNNGTSLVENNRWQSNLTGVRYGSIKFGDVDVDGDLDSVLLGADNNNNNYIGAYLNNGTNLVYNSVWSNSLTATNLGSLAFGDIDNNGKIDLVEMGIGDYLRIYINNGSTFLKNQSDAGDGGDLIGIYEGSLALGDYDSDGDLDLVATGYEEDRNRIYENNNSYFIIDTIAGTNIRNSDLHQGSLAWTDLDNDTDLDIISTGVNLTNLQSLIYISNASLTKNNTKPNPPNSSFSSSYVNNILTLSWGNGSDAETNTSGLYYNLMVGNSTNNNSIVSGVYGGNSGGGNAGGGATGYFGNMMQRKSIALNVQLEANKTYYWYAQTIDTGLMKSNWSAMQTFNTSLDVTKPNITIENSSPNSSLHTTNPFFTFNATVTDANLTNVSLHGNWTGNWHINQSNSSGVNGTYIFSANLTNNNDGHYAWYIGANDSSNNSQISEIRDFYLDRAYPLIRLISPANSASWTSSSTVTFSYNVTDVDIANCSLIINNAIDQTDTTIATSSTQTFTKTLSNAAYTWQINCTDYINFINSSSIYNLTVSYTAPSDGGGGGGGGSGAGVAAAKITQPKKFDIDFSEITTGSSKSLEVKQGDVKTFSFNSQIMHKITITEIKESSIKIIIESEPIVIILNVGEAKQIDMNEDDINDIEINLTSIQAGKASTIVKKLAGADIFSKEELEEAARKEALFDVKVSILDKFKEVFPGEEVSAKIEIFNVNNIGQVDVKIEYYLTNKEDNKTRMVQASDTLSVEAVTSFVRSLKVPENVVPGNYLFNVDVSYKDIIATSSSVEFRVVSSNFLQRKFKEIIIIAIILIVIILIAYLTIIKKKEEKLEKKEARIEREIKELEKREKFWKFRRKNGGSKDR